MAGEKVCVIGGAGFLGSHICDELSNNGYEVTIFDRYMSPYLKESQHMVVGDILDTEVLERVISQCDIVYNFAAIADLDEALDKPVETVKVNILGNVNVLEACKKYQVKRYVYASTIYVQSREGGFYRCSKHASEQYIEEYHRVYGLNYSILRYGSLYGPRSDEHNGLRRIVKRVLQSGKISYEGNIAAMREYIHVHDAARASVDILDTRFENQSLVLTGHEMMKVVDMLEMLKEILNINDDCEFLNNENGGHYKRTPYAYLPQVGKKYIPDTHIDLGQGLLELIEDVNQELEGQNEIC